MQNSSHTFAECINLFSFSLYNQFFFGKILEHEIFQVGTLRMNPTLEDIQIGHKTRTTHANNQFEGVNHIVFMRLKDGKIGVMVQSSHVLGTASIYGHVFGP